MTTKEEIISMMIPILRRYDVVRASLFGSMARGDATEDSDIDLMVEFPEGKTLLDLVGLKQDLEDLLGRAVDVLTYNSINPKLKEYILKEQEAII